VKKITGFIGMLAACLNLQADGVQLDPQNVPGKFMPVLCYHGFGPERPKDLYSFSPQRFEQELSWLKTAGYRSVTLEQIGAFCRGEQAGLPDKPVCITIDDGYRSGLTVAADLLEKYGFRAVYFVVADQAGVSKNYLSFEDMRQLLKRGFEIGLHSASHANLAKIKKKESVEQYQQRLEKEIVAAKLTIEQGLGQKIVSMSYPYGAYNDTVVKTVKKAGLSLGFSVTNGVNPAGTDPYRIRRMLLQGPTGLGSFQKRVSCLPLAVEFEGLSEGGQFRLAEVPQHLCFKTAGLEKGRISLEFKGRVLALHNEKERTCFELPKIGHPGFYLLKIRQNAGKITQGQDYLFQVIE
jgi:peptidoglycan/xylan/chitin deacetylase (PgdA/CDA1 family)